MRIDAHQHFWRYTPAAYDWIDDSMAALKRDFLPEDLRPELVRAGFDATIAVQAQQTVEETDWHSVRVFGKEAENAQKILKRG